MKNYTEWEIFCKNIRTLRERYHLSKRKMAELLHITPKTLSLLENGTLPAHTSATVIFRLSRAFGIPPKDLFILL